MQERALLILRDEMRNVEDYIELENIRFSGKIHLHKEPNIPLWNIPKFSLQLLVENAIKHGFVNTTDDLNITIAFLQTQRKIRVSNDGEPMKSKKFGIGLSNLKQRLMLLCDGNIEVVEGEGVAFEISLGECCENINR